MATTGSASSTFLLGISRSDTAARRALVATGVTHERIREAANALLRGSSSDPEGPPRPKWQFTPAGWNAVKWAEGFAIGRGETPAEDHLLVAVLWDNRCFTAAVFRRLGVDRVNVAKALRIERGYAPNHDPPPDPARPMS